MSHENTGHVLIGGVTGEVGHFFDDQLLNRFIQLLDRRAFVFLLRQQPASHRERNPADEDRAALRLNHLRTDLTSNGDVGHVERAEDVDARGFGRHARHVVVAHKHEYWHAVGEALDAFGELALLRGIGVARFESVTGEDHEVGVVVKRVGDHLVEPIQKIADTAGDAGLRIDLAVIFHADVQVGEVQNADRHLASTTPLRGHASHEGTRRRPQNT